MSGAVKGRRIPASEDIDEVGRPGDFQFTDRGYEATDDPAAACAADPKGWARLEYVCPRTGQPCGGIIIGHRAKPATGAPSWQWDGNVDAPTLTPSINCVGGCGWHGWVREGEFRSC